jgi:uncharacterized repeat protein (TIGR01451 family)
MRTRALFIAAALATAAVPATASAAVTIGSPLVANATNNAPAGSCMTGPCTYTQTDGAVAPVPQYVVPGTIPRGVIVSWSFKASSGNNAIEVLRPQGGGAYLDVGHSETVAAAGGNVVVTSPTRLAVQAGDAIGLYNDSNALVMSTSLINLHASDVVRAFDPALGATAAAPSAAAMFSQLELQATVEPDADADGFGDETQDQCPSDPTLQTACSADLQVSATATPPGLKAGQIASYTFTVHNAGSSPAVNAAVALTVPAGLSSLSLASSIGGCGGTTCSLGTLASGATAQITFSFATQSAGTIAVSAAASSATADPNPANNSASTSTTFARPDLTLSTLRAFPRTYRRGTGVPRDSLHAKAKPSSISFMLSEAATVTLTFSRLDHHNHALTTQSFTLSGRDGANRLLFGGVLPGHHLLRIGQYRLTASAATADGRRAASSSVRFTLLGSLHKR